MTTVPQNPGFLFKFTRSHFRNAILLTQLHFTWNEFTHMLTSSFTIIGLFVNKTMCANDKQNVYPRTQIQSRIVPSNTIALKDDDEKRGEGRSSGKSIKASWRQKLLKVPLCVHFSSSHDVMCIWHWTKCSQIMHKRKNRKSMAFSCPWKRCIYFMSRRDAEKRSSIFF